MKQVILVGLVRMIICESCTLEQQKKKKLCGDIFHFFYLFHFYSMSMCLLILISVLHVEEKIKSVDASKTAVFAGSRLTNEEQYLVQKFAREAIGTQSIGNFHYLGREKGYLENSIANTSFNQIKDASKIVLFGAELINDHDYVGYLVNLARTNN